jgi:hypothetical protein
MAAIAPPEGARGQAGSRPRSVSAPAVEPHRPRDSWLFVVTRGDGRRLAEVEAMFRHDPRVRVIENRRSESALLPRQSGIRLDVPAV